MKNLIAFKNNLILCPDNNSSNLKFVTGLQIRLMKLGYILSKEAFNALMKSHYQFIFDWEKEIVEEHIFTHLNLDHYEPMYKDFINTVPKLNDCELFFNQFLSYITNGQIEFDKKVIHPNLFNEKIKYTIINLGDENDFKNIFITLIGSPVALTSDDFKICEWFIDNDYPIPEHIPFKENLCMLAALSDVPVKTSTDVLRIAQYFSYKKCDLYIPSKEKQTISYKFKLTNAQKRTILFYLEKVANLSEMKEKYKMWNKLAHHIHPTKYEKRYPRAVKSLRLMNSSLDEFKKIQTFDSSIEKSTFFVKLELLKTRPGIFARKLNELIIRYPHNISQILNEFDKVCSKISNKVLFELVGYFKNRTSVRKRYYVDRNSKKRTELKELTPLKKEEVDIILSILYGSITDKFKVLPKLGNVYIDPILKNVPLPLSMRNVDESLKPIIKGQRVPIAFNKRYMLLYFCWNGSVDFDFSISTINKHNNVEKYGYDGLYRSDDDSILFSGDNTGCYAHNSELISIDLEYCDAKYILASVTNYNRMNNGFALSNAITGFMSRDDIEQSDKFIPKIVDFSLKPRSNAEHINLFLIDVKSKEWILIDENANGFNVSSANEIFQYIQTMKESISFSVYDLLKLHTDSRGNLVSDHYTANTIFNKNFLLNGYKDILKYMNGI